MYIAGHAIAKSWRLRVSPPRASQASNQQLLHDAMDGYPHVDVGDALPQGYDTVPPPPSKHRRAGVILHPTSLPGAYGIGEIGAEALRFIDWLVDSGMQLWQLLPLVPPERTYWSPYSGLDGLCGNTLLIPLDGLVQLGLLNASEVEEFVAGLKEAEKNETVSTECRANFGLVASLRDPLLQAAAERLLSGALFSDLRDEMDEWRASHAWVEDSALFAAIAEMPDLIGTPWWDWPEGVRDRNANALNQLRSQHSHRINVFIALQFLFDRFWKVIKDYATEKGVSLVGDMPIYVGGQSADVWAHRHLFELLPDSGRPALVSGVPPDAFSATGQLWGSPLYDWKAHAQEGYAWWVDRFRRSSVLYHETRVDHFRAFAGYWAVEADRDTAMVGVWKKGPGVALFRALEEEFGQGWCQNILAEDLGVITPDVVALRRAIEAPGMIVLQFAWGGGPTNTHLPHNMYEQCFVYPGTHDNQTAVGWWQTSATPEEKKLVMRYFGVTDHSEMSNATLSFDIAWAFIRAALNSVARTAVMTVQDILRLDDSARMNTPGTTQGNWNWRLNGWDDLDSVSDDLRIAVWESDRLSSNTIDTTAVS